MPHFVEVDGVERVDDDDPAPAAHRHDRRRPRGVLAGDVGAVARSSGRRSTASRDGRFTASVPLRVSMWGGAPLPPMRGPYDLEGRMGDEPFSTFVSRELIDRLPIVESRPGHPAASRAGRRDGFRVRVTRPRSEPSTGRTTRRILLRAVRPRRHAGARRGLLRELLRTQRHLQPARDGPRGRPPSSGPAPVLVGRGLLDRGARGRDSAGHRLAGVVEGAGVRAVDRHQRVAPARSS